MSPFEVLEVFPCPVYLLFVFHKLSPKSSSKMKFSSSDLVQDSQSWLLQLLWCLPLIKSWNAVAGLYTPYCGCKYQGPPTLNQWGVEKNCRMVLVKRQQRWNACVNNLDHLDGGGAFVMLIEWKPSEAFPQWPPWSTWGFVLHLPILWIATITGCQGVEGCPWVLLNGVWTGIKPSGQRPQDWPVSGVKHGWSH